MYLIYKTMTKSLLLLHSMGISQRNVDSAVEIRVGLWYTQGKVQMLIQTEGMCNRGMGLGMCRTKTESGLGLCGRMRDL